MAAFTGMRRNETFAPRWTNIDLEKGTISVNGNVEDTETYGRQIGMPKSKAGYRSFQIDSGLVENSYGRNVNEPCA